LRGFHVPGDAIIGTDEGLPGIWLGRPRLLRVSAAEHQFRRERIPRLSAMMAGELIAFYQLGYGVAAFGIGPLHDRVGLVFATIFAMGSIVAVPLAVIAAFVIRHAVARA
jgi:hypothetical protein